MADPDVVRRAQGPLESKSFIARPQALVTFGSRGFRQVLKATTRQDVGCMGIEGRTSFCGGQDVKQLLMTFTVAQ